MASKIVSSFSSIELRRTSICLRQVLSPFSLSGKKLIYGNIQQGDELIKGVEAGMLAPVFNIHDGARGAIHKLGQILLRPALGLSLALDLPAQGVEVEPLVILVHSHITLYDSTFQVRL